MRRGFIASVFLGTALLAGALVHAVTPGKLQTFQDWTVGCDNGLACQAVALTTDETLDNALSMVLKRPTGAADPLAIELSGFTAKAERYRVVIDGKVAVAGTTQIGDDSIKLEGGGAVKLARAMAKGKEMQLVDGSGTGLGSVSLGGISAALRYIDAQQGRAGSRSAVIATGRKMATAKKAMIPVITAKKIIPTNNLPDASALVALSESSPCAADRVGSTEDTAYSLGTGEMGPQALVMLNCGAGAYNVTSGIYVGQRDGGGKWTFAPARFDYGAYGFGEDKSVPLLINSDWDAATQTIGNYNKARGLGDCGSSESWVWDGAMFRMTSATAMRECRGSLDWISVWRAEVRLVP